MKTINPLHNRWKTTQSISNAEKSSEERTNRSLFSSLFYLSSFVTIVDCTIRISEFNSKCRYMPADRYPRHRIVLYVNPCFVFSLILFFWRGIVISYWAIENEMKSKIRINRFKYVYIAHIYLNNIVIAIVESALCCYISTEQLP